MTKDEYRRSETLFAVKVGGTLLGLSAVLALVLLAIAR